MEYRNIDNLVFENARILFRNFKGEASTYNRAGNRNFCVVIPDDETAEKLQADGWNVKLLAPREDADEPTYYLQVSVAYNLYPPSVYMISGNKKTLLDEESVEALDYAEFKNIDLIIRPYQWEVSGKTGVKAYLKTGYFTIEQDRFADKYANFDKNDDLPF